GLIALPQSHSNYRTILQGHHTMDLQGDGHPLVLADAAIVMGLEIGQLTVLIQGGGLEVEPRAVNVGRCDLYTLIQALAADYGQQKHLAPVILINLVAGLQSHAPDIRLEAKGLRLADPLR